MDSTNPSGRAVDGALDFSRYSTAQLHDLQSLIDPNSRPLDHARLMEEVARRAEGEAAASAVPEPDTTATGPWPVRFSRRDGLWGWLSALRRRLPVHGEGAVEVEGGQVTLHGWRRNWLALGVQDVVSVPFERIGNVVVEDAFLRFDLGRWQQVELHIASPEAAVAIAAMLPDRRTTNFERRWGAVRRFTRALDAGGRYPWVTWTLVLVNSAVFAAMAWHWQRVTEFASDDLLALGANFGPLTASGEWWRLLTAAFLHLDWLHLGVNMWALAGVGVLTERLYGRWRFAGLYLAAALIASLSSLMWNPLSTSVGASGAIYGVFGLFAAYLIRQHGQVPLSAMRTHWLGALIFILFSLFSGLMQTGVDNAAHVGGLLSGLAMGVVAATPLGARGAARWSLPRGGLVVGLALAVLAGGYARTRSSDLQLAPLERYLQARAWYTEGGNRNSEAWTRLAAEAGAGTMSALDVAERFDTDIIPFWKDALTRLRQQDVGLEGEEKRFSDALLEFVQARLAVAEAARANARSNFTATADVLALNKVQDRAAARLNVYQVRAAMSHRPSALANSTAMEVLRHRFFDGDRPCVHGPSQRSSEVAPGDSREDGPFLADELGCAAQRAFLDEDYARLEGWMEAYSRTPADLPDGGSRLLAVTSGISDLISYGDLDVDDAFGRSTAWLMAYPNSVYAHLIEAYIYHDWAWAARGHGFSNRVAPQAMALFAFRTLMAEAVLNDVKERAQDIPTWYALSMMVGLDANIDKQEIRAIFDESKAKFPEFYSPYRQMLRALMPRWRGSYGEVAGFIDRVSRDAPPGRQNEFYARLYWTYRNLEGTELDLVEEVEMEWPRVRDGLRDLVARFPRSDVWLNTLGVFACDVGDADTYREVRDALLARFSSTVWTMGRTVADCDQKFNLAPPPAGAAAAP